MVKIKFNPNLIRNFNETSGINVSQVADLDDNKLQKIKLKYPSIAVTTDADKIRK